MAAISCYQPYRSHLAQPARCYDEDPPFPQSLTLRRRQYIERCYEARTPRYPNPIPEVHVPKLPAKNAGPPVQSRRLNVDYGWSKVEEVRKKFEGAAAAASYSRSFESPPRRRLADSLFASFKLPRRKDTSGMAAPRSLAPQIQPKRKSAVEMLAETKAFYVKSETVLDRKQELPLRVSTGLSQAIAAGGCHLVSSGTPNNDVYYGSMGRASGARSGVVGARPVAGGGEGLHNTLRRLLERNDARDAHNTSGKYVGERRRAGGVSAAPPTPPPRPRSLGDSALLADVMQQHIPSPQSSPDSSSLHPEHIGTISPPAQYAHTAPRYLRSNSQSQPVVCEDDHEFNINSHKSLPDLHTDRDQTDHTERDYHSGYTERSGGGGGVVSSVWSGRGDRAERGERGERGVPRSPRRRHSSHPRTASCSSKGTRSNHSSLMSSSEVFSEHPSPGDDSYQYSSGRGCSGSGGDGCGRGGGGGESGSSGRYSHAHRDCACAHCRANTDYRSMCVGALLAPPQFADGAPPAPPPPAPAPPAPRHDRVSIHFQASAPPPQFQDDPPEKFDYRANYKCGRQRNDYDYSYTSDYKYNSPENTELQHARDYITQQVCVEAGSPPGVGVAPPFRRQRALRYKQRRPVARSKSDISDRYRRTDGRSPLSAPCETSDSADSFSSSSERLRGFFDRLGLDQRSYEELLHNPRAESVVYFSSVSSVDSNQIQDYTVQGPPTQQPIYRNAEPPSIVERNARIVKWLCQCRKLQQATLQ